MLHEKQNERNLKSGREFMTSDELVKQLNRIRCFTPPDSTARRLLSELIVQLGGKPQQNQ